MTTTAYHTLISIGLLALLATPALWLHTGRSEYAESRLFSRNLKHHEIEIGLPPLTTDIVTGSQHSCAVTNEATVVCWGRNNNGQVGDGTTVDRDVPVPVVGLASVVQVVAGASHTCARRSNGSLYCWGGNLVGQLGDGTFMSRHTPTLVSGVTDVVGIAAGMDHTCGRLSNGSLLCWGDNSRGQLGDGTTTSRNEPTIVNGVADVLDVVAGWGHSCARLLPGTVYCWGLNLSGQLGDNTNIDKDTPTLLVAGDGLLMNDIVEIQAGFVHTCARSFTGSLYCWGSNSRGQLGIGPSPNSRNTPTQVTAVTDATGLTTGSWFTCVTISNGSISCWGRNENGQLGDGTTTPRSIPAPVTGLTNVAQVAGGGEHTCARQSDGSLYCWGLNSNGQLGNGSSGPGVFVFLPVPVLSL